MKLLIYGAGVIGCSYACQLTEVGVDVTLLVRPEKKEKIEQNGINIISSDFRNGTKKVSTINFTPKVIDHLCSNNDFEYIIITANNLNLIEILAILKESAGKAHIVFFQNMWINNLDQIDRYLLPHQYFFGFPFMIGGGKDKDTIHCAISGLKYSHTPLGELDGSITPRIEKIADVLHKAHLKPILHRDIKTWIITHYAVAAGLSAGIINAGSAQAFTKNKKILKQTFKAIKEGLSVCSKTGINPKKEKSNRLYYLPLFISTSITSKVYSNDALCLMFDGHTQHAPLEIEKMLNDIILCGKKMNLDMTHLIDLSNSL